jgi:hypothetical protein
MLCQVIPLWFTNNRIIPPRARARVEGHLALLNFFTVVFYGLRIFACKTTQFCATRCERYWSGTPGIRKAMQSSEIMRNSLGLNTKPLLYQLSYVGTNGQ